MSTDLLNTAAETEAAQAPSFAAFAARMRAGVMSFVKEEDGLSTVEMLLLLFVGIVIIIAILKFVFPKIWNIIRNQINNLLGVGNTGSNA